MNRFLAPIFVAFGSLLIVFYGDENGLSLLTVALHGIIYLILLLIARLNIRDALLLTLFSWLIASVFALLLVGGYAGIFAMMLLANHVLGLLVGGILSHFVQSEKKNQLTHKITVISIILVVFLTIGAMISQKYAGGKAKDAAVNRYKFLDRVAVAISNKSIDTITTQSIITAGLAKGLYKVSGSTIYHEYGGEVNINSDGIDVTISYTRIPANKPCQLFFYFQNPAAIGFEGIHIAENNASEADKYSNPLDTGKKYCFNGTASIVEVVHTGNYHSLVSN